jgi:hypothetical protein
LRQTARSEIKNIESRANVLVSEYTSLKAYMEEFKNFGKAIEE